MIPEKLQYIRPDRLTRAGAAISEHLIAGEKPIITPYELFLEVRNIYTHGKGLYLRNKVPNVEDYHRLRRNLLDANVLDQDRNYGHRAYRILDNTDLSAEDICCLVDPFCHISHMSAMQRYGLTNRRAKSLHLSRPGRQIIRRHVQEHVHSDYGGEVPSSRDEFVPFVIVSHPRNVRKRRISVFETAHPGKPIQIRGSHARISTIGQTFLDTIKEPALCGGMVHILDIWQEYAKIHLDDIVESVENSHSKIAKVRAGYILDELLAFKDNRIDNWLLFAERGGSRVLDPQKDYAPTYSEKWMISLNV